MRPHRRRWRPGGGAAAVLRAAPAKPARPPAWAGGRAGALCAPAAAPRTAPACREAIASGGARKWDCLWRAADCKGKRRVAMAWPAFWVMRPHRRRWRPGGGAAAVLRAAPAKPARPPAWAGGRAGALCAPAAAPPARPRRPGRIVLRPQKREARRLPRYKT